MWSGNYAHKQIKREKKRAIGEILRKLCGGKGVSIVEKECCFDHSHMLLEISSVSAFVGDLEGKSSLMLYEQFSELKFKSRNREFWCRGCYVDTAGKNKSKIKRFFIFRS